jgi:hypothetical protein
LLQASVAWIGLLTAKLYRDRSCTETEVVLI